MPKKQKDRLSEGRVSLGKRNRVRERNSFFSKYAPKPRTPSKKTTKTLSSQKKPPSKSKKPLISNSKAAVSTTTAPILRLPNELLSTIFINIDDAQSYPRLYRVCRRFHSVASDPFTKKNYVKAWFSTHSNDAVNPGTNLLEYAVRYIRLHGMAGITIGRYPHGYGLGNMPDWLSTKRWKLSWAINGPRSRTKRRCKSTFHSLVGHLLLFPPRARGYGQILRIVRRLDQQMLELTMPSHEGWTMNSTPSWKPGIEDVVLASMFYEVYAFKKSSMIDVLDNCNCVVDRVQLKNRLRRKKK